MNIRLISSRVEDLSLYKSDNEGREMEFSVSTAFSEEVHNSFLIIFNLKLEADDKHTLSVQYLSQFETDEDITDEKMESKFFSINAPAIAYPFLRAFVANFLLSSGFEPKILPTINFVKLSSENQQ
jgi:preprotein translocase subunit SecB